MDEKELIELSDELVQGLTKLSLGEKPGFLAGSVYKKLSNHSNFHAIKQCYIDHTLASYLASYIINSFFLQYVQHVISLHTSHNIS